MSILREYLPGELAYLDEHLHEDTLIFPGRTTVKIKVKKSPGGRSKKAKAEKPKGAKVPSERKKGASENF